MKLLNIPFENCTFYTSSDGRVFPKAPFFHLVLVGRSNVGKSSFINHLFQKKTLAKVSSVPGKTRLVNFFLIDEKLFLVDLPGFGYAKVNKEEKGHWEEMLTTYVETFLDKITFLHLIDSRIGITPHDQAFIDYAHERGKKIFFLFTKMDKINKSERKSVEKKLLDAIGDHKAIFYSIKEPQGKSAFLREMKGHTWDH